MGLIGKLATIFRRDAGAASAPAVGIYGDGTPLWWYGAASGPMKVATVYRCVKLLGESVASMPLQYMRLRDGRFADGGDHALDYLLNVEPDFGVNAFDWKRQVVMELLLDGNAYVVPFHSPDTGRITRLALCTRHTVSHNTTTDTYTVSDSDNGIYGTYHESEIIHIKGMTAQNHKRGVSVLSYARLTLDIADMGDRETMGRFANGGGVRGLISNIRGTKGIANYQTGQLDDLAEDISRQLKARNIAALQGQTEFTQLSMSSADMQFLESRKFTVVDICRFFGVHPSFVYSEAAAGNYKSAEQANVAFLTGTLEPLLTNIETELRRKLLPASLAYRYKFSFDRSGQYACDLDGQISYRIKMLQAGATVNEVRLMSGLAPVAGGDEPLVSANLRGISETRTAPASDNTDQNVKTDEGE